MRTPVCSTWRLGDSVSDEERLTTPGLVLKAIYSESMSQTNEAMGVEVGGWVGRGGHAVTHTGQMLT